MRISEFPPGIQTTDETELVLVVQGGITQKLTLAQANALRQPLNANLTALALLSGAGYAYRDGSGNWSLLPTPGAGLWDPAGTAATLVSLHDADLAAHGGVEAIVASHVGAGGVAEHPLADGSNAGFMPALTSNVNDVLRGDGSWGLPSKLLQVAAIDDTDSPYALTDDDVIIVDSTVGAVAVDLPAIGTANDGQMVIIKVRAYSNAITINPAAPDDIDGLGSLSLTVGYVSVTLVAHYDSVQSFWSIV